SCRRWTGAGPTRWSARSWSARASRSTSVSSAPAGSDPRREQGSNGVPGANRRECPQQPVDGMGGQGEAPNLLGAQREHGDREEENGDERDERVAHGAHGARPPEAVQPCNREKSEKQRERAIENRVVHRTKPATHPREPLLPASAASPALDASWPVRSLSQCLGEYVDARRHISKRIGADGIGCHRP